MPKVDFTGDLAGFFSFLRSDPRFRYPQTAGGKAAYLAQRAEGPANVLCTLGMDSNTSKSGEKRYPLGHEPICKPDGTVLQDRDGRRSFVTTANSGPSVGKHLLMAYLPVEEAVVGNKLAVEYIGELYPVTVASAGPAAVFDPENARMKG